VVDAVRFEALHEVLTPLIEGQLGGADYVVLTKADEATPEELETAHGGIAALTSSPLFVVDATDEANLEDLLDALDLDGEENRAEARP
jgi:G3E family GTPase